METYDYLPKINIKLKQRKDMFRINTDTILLGEFLKVKDNESILDIGCNNGALLLYTKDKDVTRVGIDVLEEALKLAAKNLELNNVKANLYHSNVKDFKHERFDVIVCNPPYFNNNLINENNLLKYQRHAIDLTLDELIESFNRLLNDNGRIYLVNRAMNYNDINESLIKNKMRIKTVKFIHDEHKSEAIGVLMEIVKSNKVHLKVLNPIINKRNG